MKFFKHTFDVSTDNHWSGYLSDLHKDIDLDDLVETIDRLASRNGVPVRFKPAFDAEEVRAYYTDPYFTPKHYNKGCKIAWLSGLVYPNGDVSVCPNYIAGNIKEQPFSAIFNNDRYRSFRRTVKEVGLFPACTKCCWLYWA
jgi:MoaA/NifB/PqqE/SkfB family radical SAM enzyme